MIDLQRCSAIVAEDPATALPICSEVIFQPIGIFFETGHPACWLRDWEAFEGVLLGLMLGSVN